MLAGAAALLVGGASLGRAGGARAAHVTRPWPAERPTPGLELIDLGGRVWSLAALKGRPVLLNFWASWCEPCRVEMPSLERLAAKHGRTKLVVLTVNYQEPEAQSGASSSYGRLRCRSCSTPKAMRPDSGRRAFFRAPY